MGPENGINLNEVPYFKIEDYVKNIHLKDDLLEHMEDTNQDFTEYFNKLKNYSDYAVMTWFISMFNQEMRYSQKIENSHFISPEKIKTMWGKKKNKKFNFLKFCSGTKFY